MQITSCESQKMVPITFLADKTVVTFFDAGLFAQYFMQDLAHVVF